MIVDASGFQRVFFLTYMLGMYIHTLVMFELQYGGSNHRKFLLQVAQVVAASIGADQLVVRISPAIDHLHAMDSHPRNVGLAVIGAYRH
ncbi:hypothetical protein L1987_79816 [Smallanthus sonchifolius]|uniref:Uncharacterized protein n=1 Tax=Smallanthus sonchifolius TaxID=185202 RepID=A0ACB8YL42_9ASTR|nr:hypothetical protein L1987_79816 [Smallanthus sonchifolius]